MKTKRTKGKKLVSAVVTIICLTVFIYASYQLLSVYLDYKQNRAMLNDVQDTYYNVASEDDSEIDSESNSNNVRTGFDALLEQNENVVGWITVDGTQIDYPILQSDNNVDYLTENYNGDSSIAGSIFMDYRNDVIGDELNTVIYGHRMKDGSMFQDLIKYLDEDFFREHQTFTFDTLYDSYEAEIFTVYNTMIDFNYIETDFESDQDYLELIEEMQDKSRFETDVDIDSDDQIITLSTCDYELDPNDGRLVLQAKLTKK